MSMTVYYWETMVSQLFSLIKFNRAPRRGQQFTFGLKNGERTALKTA